MDHKNKFKNLRIIHVTKRVKTCYEKNVNLLGKLVVKTKKSCIFPTTGPIKVFLDRAQYFIFYFFIYLLGELVQLTLQLSKYAQTKNQNKKGVKIK